MGCDRRDARLVSMPNVRVSSSAPGAFPCTFLTAWFQAPVSHAECGCSALAGFPFRCLSRRGTCKAWLDTVPGPFLPLSLGARDPCCSFTWSPIPAQASVIGAVVSSGVCSVCPCLPSVHRCPGPLPLTAAWAISRLQPSSPAPVPPLWCAPHRAESGSCAAPASPMAAPCCGLTLSALVSFRRKPPLPVPTAASCSPLSLCAPVPLGCSDSCLSLRPHLPQWSTRHCLLHLQLCMVLS